MKKLQSYSSSPPAVGRAVYFFFQTAETYLFLSILAFNTVDVVGQATPVVGLMH
jgi:hypothetical protein